MSLQTRSRPTYYAAPGLHRVNDRFLREMERVSPVPSGPEGIEIARDLPVTSLPILATANDARELVRFFRKRPNGVTVIEAMNSEPRRIFDARKIAAYEFWGIIQRENERLNLTEMGRRLADALEPESRMYSGILQGVPAYRSAISRIHEEGLDIATHLDVMRYWSESGFCPDGDQQEIEAAIVCFFSLCHGAELGTATVGKRGQPARLRLDVDEVRAFLSSSLGSVGVAADRLTSLSVPVTHRPGHLTAGEPGLTNVIICTSGAVESLEHLTSLLSLAGFNGTTIQSAAGDTGLLPNAELAEMRRCQAAVFVIGPTDRIEREDGKLALRPEWVTKISVAAAIFNWRVVLFWHGELPPPEELTASGLVILSSTELDWNASLEIAAQIKSLA